MSSLFSSSGKNTPQDITIPPFTSPGGVTPQQQALGQFSLGQNMLAEGNLFGQSGLGQSTMATQGAEGAANAEALQLAGMSDVDQAAMYNLYQNQLTGFEQGLQNQLSINNANTSSTNTTLNNLAQSAGFNQGSSGTSSGGSVPSSSDAALGDQITSGG